jgi:hypothetical protein
MKYDITDIVATIVLRLGIKPPHASTGKGIPEVLR